jgi:EAL domain-containing protein (putative c-di-GMP-specific phosphodiesterase class I)
MPIDNPDVDRAFQQGEFLPHFQPLVNLRTGELQGFELLARCLAEAAVLIQAKPYE